jgi:hypothetical protein
MAHRLWKDEKPGEPQENFQTVLVGINVKKIDKNQGSLFDLDFSVWPGPLQTG